VVVGAVDEAVAVSVAGGSGLALEGAGLGEVDVGIWVEVDPVDMLTLGTGRGLPAIDW
jgi:hypothetical protein